MIASHELIGLMACDEEGGVGTDNHLPNWDCPEDIDHFRDETRGQWMIMGSETYRSMPARAFEGRHSIVLSHQKHENKENITFISAIENLPSVIEKVPQDKKLFAIGGANLVEQLFARNMIDKFVLSEIEGRYNTDRRFSPDFLSRLKQWPIEDTKNKTGFKIKTYMNPHTGNLG